MAERIESKGKLRDGGGDGDESHSNQLYPFSFSHFTQRRPQVFRFSIDHKPSCEGRETCSFSKPMISPCSEAVLLIKMMLSEIGITGAGAER